MNRILELASSSTHFPFSSFNIYFDSNVRFIIIYIVGGLDIFKIYLLIIKIDLHKFLRFRSHSSCT